MPLPRRLQETIQDKKRAALLSVGSATLLLCLKTFLVWKTSSLGILSEALHSGLDLVAAVITFLSVRVSDQPADERHLYGHGKFENFSAFLETGLLVLTAVYIIYEAFSRLFFHSVHIQPSFTAILILCAALAIDLTRARALTKAARKHVSEALEADALHFSTDVWSTVVVIFGVALVWAGNTWNLPWLAYADSFAALTVAGVILWLSSQLGRRTLDALLDVAPAGLQNEITDAIAHMQGVLRVERVRVRRAGNRHFVDATVSVPRAANLEQVHALTDAIEQRVSQIVPSDVLVHTEPRAPDNEDLFDSIRAVAQRMGHPIHDISAYQQNGNLFVELHLEVDENLSLGEAHRQATELEEAIAALGNGDHKLDVNIHIEPLGRHISTPEIGVGEMRQLELAVESFLNHMPRNYDELLNCHDVRVRQVEHHILVSCHCVMKSDYSITRIHDVLAALEDLVKERFPQISRVTIHPEPPDAS
jgi:cation diffusion facilitator family transporter